MTVQTTKGLVPLKDLEVKDIISLEDNTRIIATEWYLKGDLVRRDVNVNVLKGLDFTGSQTSI